jgi:hypothetical protein
VAEITRPWQINLSAVSTSCNIYNAFIDTLLAIALIVACAICIAENNVHDCEKELRGSRTFQIFRLSALLVCCCTLTAGGPDLSRGACEEIFSSLRRLIEAYQSFGTSNAREGMISQKLSAGDTPLYLGSHQIP